MGLYDLSCVFGGNRLENRQWKHPSGRFARRADMQRT